MQLRGLIEATGYWVPDTGNLHLRSYVDTGPLIERVYAKYAGVGWIGKNTCIINQQLGSWLFLGVILTSLELPRRRPARARSLRNLHAMHHRLSNAGDYCARRIGRPAMHFVSGHRKTRRHSRTSCARSMGRHVFGCDICQDVCPWNRKAPATSAPEFEAREGLVNPALDWLAEMQTGRVPDGVSRISSPARQTFRPATKRGDCNGK